MIKKLFGSKVLKNAGWLIMGKFAQMAINFLISLLTARYLGPANYGLISYAAAYVTFFSALCTLGINSVIVKEFIDAQNNAGKIIGTSIGLRLISSVFSVITIICAVCIIDAGETTTLIVVALSSISVVFQVFEVINYWFQSKLLSKVTAIVAFIGYTIVAIYKAILIVTGKSVVFFALATTIDYICISIMLVIAYKKHGGTRLSFSWTYGKLLFNKSKHFILPGLMVAIYSQTDKIMLKQLMGDAEIGYYAIAVSLCGSWCFILSAIIDSMTPMIMEANNRNKNMFLKRNKQLYAIIFYLSAIVSVGISVFAEPLITIMYGANYLPAVMPLRVVTWHTAFSYLGVAKNIWIVCEEKQRYLVIIYAASAGMNVLLNSLFIPDWGSVGAAAASLIAQALVVIVLPGFIKSLRMNSKMIIEAVFLHGVFQKGEE